MRLWPLLALVSLAGGAHAAPAPSGQQRFETGTRLEAQGQYQAAAAALQQLGESAPDDAFAPDALFEAAVIAEERLGEPARALALYRAVATRYPQNRLARRAQTRADFLGRALGSGEAVLRDYQQLLTRAPGDRAGAIAGMERLLAAHPDFALADRALYWLGSAEAAERHDQRAMARFAEVERRFPASEWAPRAKKARADVLLAGGHPLAARALYRELSQSSDVIARAAGNDGLDSVSGALWRGGLAVVAGLYLAVYLGAHAWRLRRGPLRPPLELGYYGPVALLFVLAGLTEHRAIGACTAIIAAGGGIITWLSGAATQADLARAPLSRRGRLGRMAAAALAALATAYLAVFATGLVELVVETLRAGPDRG